MKQLTKDVSTLNNLIPWNTTSKDQAAVDRVVNLAIENNKFREKIGTQLMDVRERIGNVVHHPDIDNDETVELEKALQSINESLALLDGVEE